MKSYLFLILFFQSFILLAEELPFIDYPFHPAREILCDQGAESADGNSHTYKNTMYALDLATPKIADPAGIYSSIAGIVISYSDCVEHNSSCGAGFGNHIKVLKSDGLMVLYAHLDSVAVRTGEVVKVGQFLGVEGNTGKTGTNNRHLHLSVHSNWTLNGYDYYKSHLGSLPDSIPYRMNICQQSYGNCKTKSLDIRKLKCRRVTNKSERVRKSN